MTKGVQDLMNAVEKCRDDFHAAIFTARDVDAALALTTEDCVLRTLPSGRGGEGQAELRRYLADELVPHLPADLAFRRVSRTGDRWRVAQEDLVAFTFDRPMPWLLPGAEPTGRRAEVLAVSIVTVQRSRVRSHRTLWDQTALLEQLGLVPAVR